VGISLVTTYDGWISHNINLKKFENQQITALLILGALGEITYEVKKNYF
jgi:hypothetical protein